MTYLEQETPRQKLPQELLAYILLMRAFAKQDISPHVPVPEDSLNGGNDQHEDTIAAMAEHIEEHEKELAA